METTAPTITEDKVYHLTYDILVHDPVLPSYQAQDQIWYVYQGTTMVVIKVVTHDGIRWQFGQEALSHP